MREAPLGWVSPYRVHRVPGDADSESAAARWLAASLTWEPAGRLRLLGRALLEIASDVLTGGWIGGIPAKRRAKVLVRRRDNDRTVITFDHDIEGEALDHLESLNDRLHSMRLFDFCRDVGIDYGSVADALPAGGAK